MGGFLWDVKPGGNPLRVSPHRRATIKAWPRTASLKPGATGWGKGGWPTPSWHIVGNDIGELLCPPGSPGPKPHFLSSQRILPGTLLPDSPQKEISGLNLGTPSPGEIVARCRDLLFRRGSGVALVIRDYYGLPRLARGVLVFGPGRGARGGSCAPGSCSARCKFFGFGVGAGSGKSAKASDLFGGGPRVWFAGGPKPLGGRLFRASPLPRGSELPPVWRRFSLGGCIGSLG